MSNPELDCSFMGESLVAKLTRYLRSEGILGTAKRSLHYVVFMFHVACLERISNDFDAAFGTNTGGIVPVWLLRLGPRFADANRYQPIGPGTFDRAMGLLGIDFQKFTFIDLGCGKGRALLLATRYGFRRIIGVEYSSALVKVATKNVAKMDRNIEIVRQDASKYAFPEGNLVVFLYNPFGGETMCETILNLCSSQGQGQVYVVYVNSVYAKHFAERGCFRELASLKDMKIYRHFGHHN